MLQLNLIEVIEKLKSEGCIVIENFFDLNEIKNIREEISPALKDIQLNINMSSMVTFNTQRFMSQLFVYSKTLVSLFCSDQFQQINEKLLGPKFHLKAARYYETGPGGISLWHHDEKQPNGHVGEGLIFIVYLSPVKEINEGPFQYIANSQHFSNTLSCKEQYYNANIQNNYKDKIKTVFGDIGTLIIADSRVIHRATPHSGPYIRSSLFFQISKMGESVPYKEKILIDPGLFQRKYLSDDKILNMFGFEIKSTEHIFPITDYRSIPINKSFKIISLLFFNINKRILKGLFEALPVRVKNFLRRKILNTPMDYESIKKN